MHYAPRTVGLFCELHHAPKVVDAASLQRFHGELLQGPTPAYRSFHALPNGVVLANPTGRQDVISAAEFLPDRVRFREEQTGATADDFAARVAEVVGRAAELRGVDGFVQQIVGVRTLVNPRHYADSRAFLREGLLGLATETQAFGREPALFGVTFAFPPTADEPHAFTLRAESSPRDARSIMIENHGAFAGAAPRTGDEARGDARPPLDAESASRNVLLTYDFLVTRALDFLSQFDVRLET